jgi:hypothetical protein
MKKVNVFTMLMCFLAGTANFPCYGGIVQSIFSKSGEEDKNKTPTVKQQAAHDLADAPVPPVGQHPTVPAAPNVQVEAIAAAIRSALPEGHQAAVTININMGPQSDPLPNKSIPLDAFPLDDNGNPANSEKDTTTPDPKPEATPQRSAKSVTFEPVLSDENKTTSLVNVVSYGSLSLMIPADMELKQHRGGQLALLPNICALYIYPSLSKADHPDFHVLNTQPSVVDEKTKKASLGWIRHYLERYGKNSGHQIHAMQLFSGIETVINSADEKTTSLKVGHKKDEGKFIFSLHAEGGPVIFAKIPGQDQ